MINRVLIRIKVVQLLYSYLLNQSEFRIAEPPADPSRDSRYAYTLYLDLMLLVLELSGYDVRPGRVGLNHPTTNGMSAANANKLARALLGNDEIKSIMTRDDNDVARFDSLLLTLLDKIKDSTIYRSYIREKNHSLKDDTDFWTVVMSTIVARNPAMLTAARTSEEFTNVGYEKAFEMAVDSFKGFTENSTRLVEARNALEKSFDKAYELYNRLLQLMVDLTDLQEIRLDNAKHKFLPTPDDLNPPMRFVENSFINRLRQNADFAVFNENNKQEWPDSDLLMRRLLDKILDSELYAEYMAAEKSDYAADCEFWRKAFKYIILPSEELAEALESESVYWNDDLDIMGTFVVKTIKRFASSPDQPVELLPKFKNDEDARFGAELFSKSVAAYDTCREQIARFTSDTWDMERMAFMDVVILTAAITEILNYPQIPVVVTINEYVETANCYSTPKSGSFINGMLSNLVAAFRKEGLINKN